MSAPHAVLLIGSARPRGSSNSEALGSYLAEKLQGGGMSVATLHVGRVREERMVQGLLPAIDGADLWVLASPVYGDSLPFLVTRCFERIAAHRKGSSAPRTRFIALLNCGLPEPVHTQVPLAICRCFAREARLEWAGGLGLGGGEALGGKPLASLGSMTRNIRRSLDLTAAALLEGREVPPEAVLRMAQPMLPAAVYTLLGNLGWLRRAWAHRTLRELGARPYAR